MDKLKIEYVDINSIKPYKKNPRKNEKAIPYVMESIKQFGFKNPVILDKDNVIVAGHTRIESAKRLGITEIPCIYADDLTDEQIKAFRLADNKVGEIAEWDIDLLDTELDDILNIDMSDFGFDLDLEDEEEKEIIEDEVPEVPEEPKANLGDIYQLGNHRLMCGDSTKEEDVAKLMNGEIVDLVITDPPYNVALWDEDIEELKKQNHRTDGLTIKNDKLTDSEFHLFLVKAFNNMKKSLKDGGVFYVWYAPSEVVNFQTSLEENDFQIREELIWNKGRMVFGRQDYQWQHEPCLYGWKDGASHYFIDDRTQTTVFEDKKPDIKKMKKEELVKLLEEIYSDKVSTTIINESKPSVSELHPTMKPVKLIARQVKNSSRINEKVLDLFGGSGTTLITCEQLNRNCYMMEYDPHYVDVIIQRWENFTGEKAIKLN